MSTLDITLVVGEYPVSSGSQKLHNTFYHANLSEPGEEETGMLSPGVHPAALATAIFERFGKLNVSVINLKVPCERSKFPAGFQTREFSGYTPLLGKWTHEHLRELFPSEVLINYKNGEA